MMSQNKPEQPNFQHPQPQSQQPEYNQVYTYTPDLPELIPQVQELQKLVDELIAMRVNFNTDIIGMIEGVAVAPTGTPTSVYGQLKIYNGALYWYSNIDKAWHTAGGGGTSGTITYIKTVNFVGSSVTTGTITVSNGVVTAFT